MREETHWQCFSVSLVLCVDTSDNQGINWVAEWQFITLHCTALHCTALHCTALNCTALHCTALHCTVLHCTALHCTTLHWTWQKCTPIHSTSLCVHLTALQYTTLYCNKLNCTAIHLTTLRYTALYCNTMNCTALHWTALQYASLHYTALAVNHCLWLNPVNFQTIIESHRTFGVIKQIKQQKNRRILIGYLQNIPLFTWPKLYPHNADYSRIKARFTLKYRK